MHLRRVISSALLACVLFSASPAAAWQADFFEKDASGTATYEEMAIYPQAIHDSDEEITYIVYQGYRMDPYAMEYDHIRSRWRGPYQIGTNPLGTDHHGAPAIVIDDAGHVVVFWGGHNGRLQHARTIESGDLSSWQSLGTVSGSLHATYPQPVLEPGGAIRLHYRRDNSGANKGNWESVLGEVGPGGTITWGVPEKTLKSDWDWDKNTPVTYWYVNVDSDEESTTAMAAVRRDYAEDKDDFFVRRGVYYLERSAEGTWTAAGGAPVDEARDYEALVPTATVVPEQEGYTNQVVVRRDGDGVPGVLYLITDDHDTGVYEWRFSRWDPDAQEWEESEDPICETDYFFDAGTFEFLSPDGQEIEAFLTIGSYPDDQWIDDPFTPQDESRYAPRGGDITHWRSEDGGMSWDQLDDVINSPGPHARYNNPQIVRGYHDEARLLFSEWNNDGSNFIHKVFLWGSEGFKQRQFTPKSHRLAGANRVTTAIEISKQGFPVGSNTVVVAAAHDFPDVLCGVPLAQALRAPILLTHRDTLAPSVAEEITRLRAKNVVILGGNRAVSSGVETAIRSVIGSGVRVERIAGADRYDTSARVAKRLADLRGESERVVLASGECFADALAVSPYAARRGYPVLLTPRAWANTHISGFVVETRPEEFIVVGGEAAISSFTVASYEALAGALPGQRWAGDNRYETARAIAEQALAAGHSLERFSVATGESFADAVGGGLLAARCNSVLLTTPSNWLHPAVVELLDEQAFGPGTGVLDVYVLGGPVAVSPNVENSLMSIVHLLDAEW